VLFPSTMHTWKRMYSYQGLQVPKYEHLEEEVLQTFSEMFEAFDRDSRNIPSEQFYQLSYESLAADPLGALERLYGHFGFPISSQVRDAWSQYAANAKKYEKNKHELTPTQRQAIVTRWQPYFARYSYSTDPSS
jgi:omega-hydroxy-beta-dihydromenaquinone-9 sulfotransferase